MYLDFAIPSLPTALCPPFAHQATRFKLLIENVSRLLLMESYWMTSVMMNWDVVDYDFVFWSAKPWLIFLHYTEEAELLLPRSSTMPPPQNALMTINTTQTQKRTLAWRKNQKKIRMMMRWTITKMVMTLKKPSWRLRLLTSVRLSKYPLSITVSV